MEYGIQMYSLRDITGDDLAGAFKAVADMGYKTVETAGFFGHSAKEVLEMIEKNGLRLVGTHSGWEDLAENFEETLRFHKELGNKRYIIPGASFTPRANLERFIEFVNFASPKLKAEGIDLGFHNHSSEFIVTEEGYHIHHELQNRTDLFFEIDTYWAYVAGVDPVAELERLGDRVKMIHLKDGTRDGNGLALGEGTAPVAAVRKKAIEMGLDIVVESEGCQPTGIEEAKRCIDHLRYLDSQD